MARVLPLLLLAALGASADEKPERVLQELTRKLERRRAMPSPTPVNTFLHDQAAGLIERASEAQRSRYLFDRLTRAAEQLLEASESIFEAKPDNDRDDDDRQEAARRLERTYFRVQQADYFAAQGKREDGGAFTRHCRALYQQARAAYDQNDYRTARKLAEAAAGIVSALERMAQAEVRVPEPPRLK